VKRAMKHIVVGVVVALLIALGPARATGTLDI
jgi:hypothetical protein